MPRSVRNGVEKGENNEWYSEVPLIVDGRIYGRVEITAPRSVDHYDLISKLLSTTAELEPKLLAIAQEKVDSGRVA